jgi:beta-phosphoglucomutase-like phosphatase (HAD superfamily)
MIKYFDNFLFDFDDTLVNSGKEHEKAFRLVIKKHGNNIKKINDFNYDNIKGLKTIEALKKIGFTNKLNYLTSCKQNYYKTSIKKIKFFPYALKLIDYLQKKKKNIFIVSGGSKENIKKIITKKNFAPKGIISSESCKQSKPQKKPYELCILKYNLKIKRTIAIEDSLNGIKSAKKNKIFTVGVYNVKIINDCDVFFKNIKQFYKSLI